LPKKQSTILLLHGPSGVGETLYCKQFLTEGLLKGDRCIFVSTALSKMQFDALFSSEGHSMFLNLLDFVNPLDRGIARSNNNKNKSISGRKLVTMMVSDVGHSLETTARDERKIVNTIPSSNMIHKKASTEQTRLVLDSITHMLLLLRGRIFMQFIMDLTSLLKHFKATAILTLTTSTNDQSLISNLGSILDGVLEMRLKENSQSLPVRSFRVRHLKGAFSEPRWIHFRISANGNIIFSRGQRALREATAELKCTLCAKPIIGTPLVRSDFTFDSKECIEIFQRLEMHTVPGFQTQGCPQKLLMQVFSL